MQPAPAHAAGVLDLKTFVPAKDYAVSRRFYLADAWWRLIEATGLVAKYPGAWTKAPSLQPWGLRVLYLADRSGVLWHIADRRTA